MMSFWSDGGTGAPLEILARVTTPTKDPACHKNRRSELMTHKALFAADRMIKLSSSLHGGGLIMNEFCPGQRVLCIDGKFHPMVWEYVDDVPIEGEVYTVDWIRRNGRDHVTGKIGPALALKELSGTLPGIKSVVCWCVWRFAPLDVAETNSAARKKKSGGRRYPSRRSPRRNAEPVLV